MPERTQKLAIYLIKAHAQTSDDAFRSPRELQPVRLKAESGVIGAIYTRRSSIGRPKWRSFLEKGADGDLSHLTSASAAAVLIVESAGRLFAVCFGYGNTFLRDDMVERRFGLKVALNSVIPEKIRSVDLQQFDDITTITVAQASRATSQDTFGLDVQRDVMRAVTGEVSDKTFATRLTGRDALVVQAKVDFADVPSKCAEALRRYGMDTYRQHFAWVDHLAQVRDAAQVRALDERLIEAIKTRALDKLHLAPPRLIDYEKVLGFRYPGERKTKDLHIDLDITDYISSRPADQDWTLDALKGQKIRAYYDEDTAADSFSVYSSAVFETKEANKTYVLSFGEWFEVADGYVDDIERRLAALEEDAALPLPVSYIDEREGDYNARAANAPNADLALMDQKLVRIGGDPIEVCDLLSLTGDLIHVKRKLASGSLSHLFAQGVNSADALLFDPALRQQAVVHLPASHKAVLDRALSGGDVRVVYAIITKSADPIKTALPFFSKQSVVNAAERLRRMGVSVALRKILAVDRPVAMAA